MKKSRLLALTQGVKSDAGESLPEGRQACCNRESKVVGKESRRN